MSRLSENLGSGRLFDATAPVVEVNKPPLGVGAKLIVTLMLPGADGELFAGFAV